MTEPDPTAPQRAAEAIAAKHGQKVAESVLAILDDLGLTVRRRQTGDKQWARISRRLATEPGYRDRYIAAQRAERQRAQHETDPTAGRRGLPWTGPELEIIARTDLTAEEAAQMTGRTFYGVEMQRKKLRIDPRKDDLAGLGRRGPDPEEAK